MHMLCFNHHLPTLVVKRFVDLLLKNDMGKIDSVLPTIRLLPEATEP